MLTAECHIAREHGRTKKRFQFSHTVREVVGYDPGSHKDFVKNKSSSLSPDLVFVFQENDSVNTGTI